MILATFLISLTSLLFSVALFWRVHVVLRRLRAGTDYQELAAQQKDLVAAAKESIEQAYHRIRRNLADAGECIRRVKAESSQAGQHHARMAGEHLESLSGLLEEGVRAASRVTLSTARQTQEAIADRVRQLKARAMLLLAETKATAAREAVMNYRFESAEELLDESAELIRRVSNELAGEPRYAAVIESIQRALRESIVSLRAHAEITVKKMDRLLAESTQLVEQLESDEARMAPVRWRAPELATEDAAA